MTIATCRYHVWVALDDGGFGCEECDARARECAEGEHPSPLPGRLVCDRCVGQWQKVIVDIRTWATTYQQDPYSPISSPRFDPNQVATSEDDVRLPFGLDSVVSDMDDGRIEALRNVGDALEVLAHWARRWARRRGHAVPRDPLGYLVSETLWATENRTASAWLGYVGEVRRVRALVRRLVGIAPEREPVPCVHCSGQIIREWGKHGLAELRRCTGCGLEWPEYWSLSHTNYLVLQGLPESHPSMQVTLADANRIYRGRIAPNQLHMWAKRRKLLAVDRDVRGDDVYMLGEIAELVAASAQKSEGANRVRA